MFTLKQIIMRQTYLSTRLICGKSIEGSMRLQCFKDSDVNISYLSSFDQFRFSERPLFGIIVVVYWTVAFTVDLDIRNKIAMFERFSL